MQTVSKYADAHKSVFVRWGKQTRKDYGFLLYYGTVRDDAEVGDHPTPASECHEIIRKTGKYADLFCVKENDGFLEELTEGNTMLELKLLSLTAKEAGHYNVSQKKTDGPFVVCISVGVDNLLSTVQSRCLDAMAATKWQKSVKKSISLDIKYSSALEDSYANIKLDHINVFSKEGWSFAYGGEGEYQRYFKDLSIYLMKECPVECSASVRDSDGGYQYNVVIVKPALLQL